MNKLDTKLPSQPRDRGRSNETRRAFDTKNLNALDNPFSKLIPPSKETKPIGKKAVRFSVIKTTPRKQTNRNILSPKPARVEKVKKPWLTSIFPLTTASRPKASKDKPKKDNAEKIPRKPNKKKQQKAKLPSKQSKLCIEPSKRAKPPKPEHPLAFAFKGQSSLEKLKYLKFYKANNSLEATAAYQTHLKNDGPQAVAKAASALSLRLDAADKMSLKLLAGYNEAILPLTTPFKDEKLLLTLRHGQCDEEKMEVTIGQRIDAFAKFVKEKERMVNDSWGLWDGVMRDIERLGAGLDMKTGPFETDGFEAQIKKLEEEYLTKRAEILKEYDDESSKLHKKAAASEKKYEAAIARQRQAIMRYMQLETGFRDSSEEQDDEDEESTNNENEEIKGPEE